MKAHDYRLPWCKQHQLLSRGDRWQKQAELLKLTKKARQKLAWFIYYHTKGRQSAAVTIRFFGISKSVFYKWLAVFDPQNLKALEEGSRAPIKRRGFMVAREEEDRILAMRKLNPEYGKMKLKAIYERENHESVSSWKIQR